MGGLSLCSFPTQEFRYGQVIASLGVIQRRERFFIQRVDLSTLVNEQFDNTGSPSFCCFVEWSTALGIPCVDIGSGPQQNPDDPGSTMSGFCQELFIVLLLGNPQLFQLIFWRDGFF